MSGKGVEVLRAALNFLKEVQLMKMKMFLVVLMVLILPVMAFAQLQQQGQIGANQSQSQSQAGALGIGAAENNTTFISPNIPLQAQPIYPYLLQMVPGVVADVTKDMPVPDAIQPLKDERYVKVTTFNGWCLDRIRMEDVEAEVIDHIPAVMKKFGVTTTERLRYRIGMKMSSRTIGSGGGGGGSVAGFGGGANPLAYGSNASIMPAIAVNTADPQFVIRYYLTPIPLEKKAGLEEEYLKQGYKKVE
jgi:hypothetical protein